MAVVMEYDEELAGRVQRIQEDRIKEKARDAKNEKRLVAPSAPPLVNTASPSHDKRLLTQASSALCACGSLTLLSHCPFTLSTPLFLSILFLCLSALLLSCACMPPV
jgi:hypothetical protein